MVPQAGAKRHSILMVDDDPLVLEMLRDLFDDSYTVYSAASGDEAITLARRHTEIAAVVMDIRMPGTDGISAAREIKKSCPDLPVIFHTGYPGDYDEDEIDREEVPFDFILKGEAVSRLIRSVRNAVASHELKLDSRELTDYAENVYGIIGRSQPMRDVYALIRKLAGTKSKAMILGETGTGKELVARAIHYTSACKDMRFAILNCNHKSSELVESELFGHTLGAFTGAVAERPGLFEYANGGTVFLDEIGDLDLTTQAKLLRVLETGEYQKVGSEEMKRTEVRVLCAANIDLEQMVGDGTFREDLFFRLKGVVISLPPLRSRREDIPLLVEKTKDRFTIEQGLSPKHIDRGAIDVLVGYDWPGNVRQLIDTVESLIVLTESDIIMAEDVVRYLGLKGSGLDDAGSGLSERVRQFERSQISDALRQNHYNISATARALKLDRTSLRRKMKSLEIEPEKRR